MWSLRCGSRYPVVGGDRENRPEPERNSGRRPEVSDGDDRCIQIGVWVESTVYLFYVTLKYHPCTVVRPVSGVTGRGVQSVLHLSLLRVGCHRASDPSVFHQDENPGGGWSSYLPWFLDLPSGVWRGEQR